MVLAWLAGRVSDDCLTFLWLDATTPPTLTNALLIAFGIEHQARDEIPEETYCHPDICNRKGDRTHHDERPLKRTTLDMNESYYDICRTYPDEDDGNAPEEILEPRWIGLCTEKHNAPL